jgi:hypothetical protein
MSFSLQCIECIHFDPVMSACAAFKQIPVAILSGEYDHTKPYPGDHGIQFERLASLVK